MSETGPGDGPTRQPEPDVSKLGAGATQVSPDNSLRISSEVRPPLEIAPQYEGLVRGGAARPFVNESDPGPCSRSCITSLS